jgi:hypothetical protein
VSPFPFFLYDRITRYLVDRTTMTTTSLSQGETNVVVESWFDTAAGVMGNVLEWYDFALFGFFSGKLNQSGN